MPTTLLTCESCGNRQTFFLDDASVKEMQGGKTTPRHCLRCRTTTDWVFTLMDRRSGRDRRQGGDPTDESS
jgi:DNA-directed RNA polymerase subunit M/transcription elongation factor TFIIS